MPGMSFPDTPHSTEPQQVEASEAAAPTGRPDAPRPKRSGIAALAIVGVLVLMAGTGLGVWHATRPDATKPAAPAPSVLDVAGTVTLKLGQFTWNSVGEPTCQGWQGFADVAAGAQVTVTDASGKTLAVGAVGAGTAQGITTLTDGSHRADSCLLPFKVAGVARGVGPYGVEVSHRGVLRYNEGDLAALKLGFN